MYTYIYTRPHKLLSSNSHRVKMKATYLLTYLLGSVIQDLSASWCIKGTGESTLVMDAPVPLMHHDSDRSWITDSDPDHPKGTQP